MSRICYRLASLIITGCLFLITPGSSAGSFLHSDSSHTEGVWDSLAVAEYFNRWFKEQMNEHKVPGATFSLVRKDTLLFNKAYGVGDVETGEKIIPEKTTFFAGSVSKLFTSTAIMQLYEKGLVSLDTDVNEYLEDFVIDDRYPEPVTIKHLLTHTGGFEERALSIATLNPEERMTVSEYIARDLHPRVMPPGKYLSYSNYGMTLLGYIVEQVSGMKFSEYIDARILGPLEMDRSSFAYPDSLVQDLATSYNYNKRGYQAMEIPYINVGPAGALITTSTDMASFVIAHLQKGMFADTAILDTGTAELMHSRLYAPHPELEGMCHGFYENFLNNERLIQHAGDINGYGSLLVLIPGQGTGFFVSISGGRNLGMGFRDELTRSFMDHFFPAGKPRVTPCDGEADMGRYEGVYRLNRYSRLSFEKIAGLIFEGSIKAGADKTLVLHSPAILGEPPSEWIMTEPQLFRNPDDGKYMYFEEDAKGRITHMNVFKGIPGNFIKVPWYGTGKFTLPLLAGIILMTLMVLPGWRLARWIRRLRRKSARKTIEEIRARKVAVAVAGLNLFFLVGTLTASVIAGNEVLGEGLPFYIRMFFVVPLVSLVCTLALALFALRVWYMRMWNVAGRTFYMLQTLAAVAFMWFLHYWNLLGFHF